MEHDDLIRWIHGLRSRLAGGELATSGPLDLDDGTNELRGETVVRVLLADLDHLGKLRPETTERDERLSELLRDFRRLRDLLGWSPSPRPS